jgi:hypothetical protein
MSRLICPKCITGKVSYQLAKLKSGRVVLDWNKCSTFGCTDDFAFDGIKGNKSALTNIDYYYKINSD